MAFHFKQNFVGAILLCMTVAACAQPDSRETIKENNMNKEMATDRNKQAIRNLYEKIINERKLDQLNTVISDEFTTAGGPPGVEGYRQTVVSLVEGFPDIRFTIEDIMAEGEKVIVRWNWKGTHTGAFRGIAASNKAISNDAIVIYEFKNGKAIRSWLQADRLGVLQQIGIVPTNFAKKAGE
jgi:predicted ester cyclase